MILLLVAFMMVSLASGAYGQVSNAGSGKAQTIEIPFKSHDGHAMLGKLTIPATGGPHPLVLYVQTAEGATVDIRRANPRGGTFNYFDLYREKLPEMNVAFFSYEGRGISMGTQPPRYETIDWAVYNTSTLENKVRDILSALKVVREQKAIDGSRIFLMGTSEGTLLAAEAASRAPNEVNGLVLYSILSTTLKDALKYMTSDGAFLSVRGLFDTDKDGSVTEKEYDADPQRVRGRLMKERFDQLDTNKDGVFAADDMRQLVKPVLDGIESENVDIVNARLKTTAGVSIPEGWVKDHFAHAPMWTFLSQLTMPIGLFHAIGDNLTPVEGTRSLEQRAKQAGKSNMQFHYFEGLDHSLGITLYFVRGTLPEGHKAIFEYIGTELGKK